MKKLFYITLAVVAFASCTKSEASYTASEEIAFTPVSKFETKTAITGETYKADLPFYVFANAKNTNETTFSSKYFEKILFKPDGTNKIGDLQIFKGDSPQYWPNVNNLIFAGFTQSGNVASILNNVQSSDNLTTLTIPGYVQPEPTDNTDPQPNDLMYFFDDNNGSGYGSSTTHVSPVMKHACSWITINVKADENLVTYWTDLKALNIQFVSLHETGTVTLKSTDVPSWELTSNISNVDILSNPKDITSSFEEFANSDNNTIVLPQTPTFLSVTYSYTTPAGTSDFKETKLVPLNFDGKTRGADQTDDQWRATWTKWEPGKHYTYDLTITAEEIKIAPSSAEWTDYDADGAAAEVQNPSQTI